MGQFKTVDLLGPGPCQGICVLKNRVNKDLEALIWNIPVIGLFSRGSWPFSAFCGGKGYWRLRSKGKPAGGSIEIDLQAAEKEGAKMERCQDTASTWLSVRTSMDVTTQCRGGTQGKGWDFYHLSMEGLMILCKQEDFECWQGQKIHSLLAE